MDNNEPQLGNLRVFSIVFCILSSCDNLSMNARISHINGITFAEITSDALVIRNLQDALDLIGNCAYQGVSRIIIQEKNILPAFFDLKNGIAGEILQKFSTYQMSLTIVGDFSTHTAKSLRDFIYESNQGSRVNFASSIQEAKNKLVKA